MRLAGLRKERLVVVVVLLLLLVWEERLKYLRKERLLAKMS